MKYLKSLLAVGFIILLFSGCGSEEPPKKEVIRPVKAMFAGGITDIAGEGYPAITKAKQEAAVSFKVGGPIIKYNVIEGAKAKKGSLIAELDPRDYILAEQSARARYEQTKAEAGRYERLWKKGSVAKNDYDIKKANFLEAKAAWESAKNNLNDTKLYAPFTGYYGAKLVEIGEEVKPKQPITTLYDLSKLEVYATIPEQLAVRFRDFQSYEVTFETYPGQKFSAELKEMGKAPSAEGYPLYLYLDYKIDVNNPAQPKISAGMSCRVTIKLGRTGEENNEIIVPLGAVFEGETDNQPSVWIINRDNLTVAKRPVTLGDFVGKDHVIIKSGLKAGEQIVAAGSRRLIEGQKVKILNQENFN